MSRQEDLLEGIVDALGQYQYWTKIFKDTDCTSQQAKTWMHQSAWQFTSRFVEYAELAGFNLLDLLAKITELEKSLKRCQHVSDSPWGKTQCTQPVHDDKTKHLYSPSETLQPRPSDEVDDVTQAIKDYAAANEELGWKGDALMAENAQEIAFFLADRGLLKS